MDSVVVLEIVVISPVLSNKGGGEKKGGLEVPPINLVENPSVVTTHPPANPYLAGPRNGRKSKCPTLSEGKKSETATCNRDDPNVTDKDGNAASDPADESGNDALIDEDCTPADSNGHSHKDWIGRKTST